MASLDIPADKIKCGGCAAIIRERLSQLPGVRSVEVTVADGIVHVEGDDTLDPEAVRQALRDAGYPPRD